MYQDAGYDEATRPTPNAARILVVDDSPTAVAFASRALREAGHEVRTATDIWVAEVVSEFEPDLVLMDVYLGSFQGTVAARALARRVHGRGLRIVLFSSEREERLQELVGQCGAVGFIRKTDDPRALAAAVGAFLEDRAP